MNSLMSIVGDRGNNSKHSYHMPSGAQRNIIRQPLLWATHMHMESIHT